MCVKEKVCKKKDCFSCSSRRAFLFSFVRTKEKETKRKGAGCRSEAKKSGISLNEKNSLRSNSFSFFTGNVRFFFTLLHGGRGKPPGRLTLCFARWMLLVRSMLVFLLRLLGVDVSCLLISLLRSLDVAGS